MKMWVSIKPFNLVVNIESHIQERSVSSSQEALKDFSGCCRIPLTLEAEFIQAKTHFCCKPSEIDSTKQTKKQQTEKNR